MSTDIRRIAVNTGGGDAPGLNAVIRAVVRSAERLGWEVVGIRGGYDGLFDGDGIIPLDGGDGSLGIAHSLFQKASRWWACPRRSTTISPPPTSPSAS